MAKKDKEFKSEVIEHIADLRTYNSGNTKSVLRMIWGDNPMTMDIRMVTNNKDNKFIGKGISLSDDECDQLVDILLDNGYGSIDKIKETLVKNMKRTNPDVETVFDTDDTIDCVYIDDEGYTVVDIPMYD